MGPRVVHLSVQQVLKQKQNLNVCPSTALRTWNHTDSMGKQKQLRRLSCLLFFNSSVLSGWVKKAMVNNLPVVPMRLMSSQAPGDSSWMTLTEDLILDPGLRVDGPVDDVKEDVRPGKHNPRVLVYGVGVYPNVHVAPGRLHLARNLRIIQRHLG